MSTRFRRIPSYKPRIRRTKKEISKQRLCDMQREISSHVGRLLVLIKEGNKEQVETAQYKARIDLIKTAPEMRKLAEKVNQTVYSATDRYLHSVEVVVHTPIIQIDPFSIDQCYLASRELEDNLKTA
ncbi:MAG: hypothetical protein RLZZ453_11 [Chlamydiota bacterium]